MVFILLFSGCDLVPHMPTQEKLTTSHLLPSEGRFKVEKIQSFVDRDAYSESRDIFIITDSKNGKQFIGISGVGISELGSHTSGKTTIQDER